MNYAIATKFLGPTNTRGARVKATLYNGKSVTLKWDHALNGGENHYRAAAQCVSKYVLCESYLADKAPWAHEIHAVHGLNGYVVMVGLVDKDKAISY